MKYWKSLITLTLIVLINSCSMPFEKTEVTTPSTETESETTGSNKTESDKNESETQSETEQIIERFSNALGYNHATFLLKHPSQMPNAGYLVRGLLDFQKSDVNKLLLPETELIEAYNTYVENYVKKGVEGNKGPQLTLEEIYALSAPTSLYNKYSYSYGYYLGSSALNQYDDINFPAFTRYLWNTLFSLPIEMTEKDMEKAIEDYNRYRQDLINQMLEELRISNLKEANDFLAKNKEKDGVIVLNPYVQIEFIYKNTEESAQVQLGDNVKVNYQLRTLEGLVLDNGTNREFPMDTNIMLLGFLEGCTAMRVGDKAIVYVHPEHGYGSDGIQAVPPNKLLIFDIEILEIVK